MYAFPITLTSISACICSLLRVLYAQPRIRDEDDNWATIQNNMIA